MKDKTPTKDATANSANAAFKHSRSVMKGYAATLGAKLRRQQVLTLHNRISSEAHYPWRTRGCDALF